MRTFTSYREFVAAVEAAGLEVYSPPTGHEGMHESDPYNPCFAMTPGDEDCSRAFGDFANNPDGTAGGVLFDTMDEYCDWVHGDDPMGDFHGRNY